MRVEPSASFTLDQFAEIASFSAYHFARLFRQVVGIPPGEFHAALRYQYAKHLLLKTDLSITDICFEVGYDSLGTFSARFKQLVGLGPATFRALPDVLNELDGADRRIDPVLPPGMHAGMTTAISGYFANAHELPGMWRAYVGLFPAFIARNRPVAGIRIRPHELFFIHGAPKGTYRLLSAIVPMGGDAVDRLLPSDTMRVAAANGPIEVGDRGVAPMVRLTIREVSPHDPPVLIALPALDFPTVNAASTIVRDAFAHLGPAMHADTRGAMVAR
jgi:AraC family transcriptional regulator